MKSFYKIAWRFLKAVYALIFILGLFITWIVWKDVTPQFYKTYSYGVTCDNGKIFDPTSKPIRKIDSYSEFYGKPFSFNEDELKAECEYGTAWLIGLSNRLQKNYQFESRVETHATRTKSDQIEITMAVFSLYYVLIEILRRTFLYVVFGKNFITLKH